MPGLSAHFVVLLSSSCFFALCVGILNITAEAGEDVTLQCQKPTNASITAIEWSRPDLGSDDYVFLYRDKKQSHKHYQHPSFRGRVELRDPEMKNGDASVILKNVNINDTGTYECDVTTGSSGRKRRDTEPTQSIKLKVTESGLTAGSTEEGGDEKGGHKEGGNLGFRLNHC
ncbi:coxsackievirus and adenovirus receptor homolog [Symphorus nematophorus]